MTYKSMETINEELNDVLLKSHNAYGTTYPPNPELLKFIHSLRQADQLYWQEAMKAERDSVKLRYSGDDSRMFWELVNLKSDDKLYEMACDLQELESKVLKVLTNPDAKTPN